MHHPSPLSPRRVALALILLAGLAAHCPLRAAPWSAFASLEDRPAAQVAPGLARLLFLRPGASQDSGAAVDVWVDGRFHTTVLPGAFSEAWVCPGKRALELAGLSSLAGPSRSSATLNALPRQTSYVLVQSQGTNPVQTLLSADQAQALLPPLRRQSHAVSRIPVAQDCPPMEPPPAVVAEQGPPPAAVVPPAASPPPSPTRYTLSAEMLFKFGGSKPQHLSEQGQTQIVRLAKRIKDNLRPGQVVLVQGHTDPMGSNQLNQRLSLERAQTVSQIMANAGLPARQMRPEGLGSSLLLVTDCQRQARNREEKLSCNRPNRRVEITVLTSKN